jgi:radical SAM superfamily enzyme YgiQ (UPF0313 family)
MRVLLIFPPSKKILRTTQPSFVAGSKGTAPPLGLLYLASAIKDRTEHEVKILDLQLPGGSYDDLAAEIRSFKPQVVGISAITFMLLDVIETVAAVRQAARQLDQEPVVVCGGPHVTVFPAETAQLAGVDYALAGEAEFNFLSLLNNLGDHEALAQLPGLSYLHDGKLVQGPEQDLIHDLDTVPMPDRRLVSYRRYSSILAGGKLMTTMMTSRGCPFKCIFCDRLGKVFRPASAEYVVRELADCVELGVHEIFFHDDTFTVDKKRVLDICAMIREKGWRLTMDCRSRVNTIDEELLVALKGAGLRRISFGVETGSAQILKRIKKGITLEQARTAFGLARKHGIITLADFMIGHPDETVEDVKRTIRFARELNPDYAQFSITTPYPATVLYQEAMDRGIIKGDVWREFAKNPTDAFEPPRWDEIISRPQLVKLLNEAYRGFYMRPRFILRELGRTKNLKAFARKAVVGLKMGGGLLHKSRAAEKGRLA